MPEFLQDGREVLAAGSKGLRDGTSRVFVVAMVLFHFANAPGGVYLGLFMKQDLAPGGPATHCLRDQHDNLDARGTGGRKAGRPDKIQAAPGWPRRSVRAD